MALPGYRDNRLILLEPTDLERATRHVARPSAGQAAAGNYRKGHVVVGGLHVTIEVPKHGIRRGTKPDGTSWAVMMPADYGYIKGSEGYDDQQIDVYLGPYSHQVDVLPVWIIDQCDADTRAFDEHKCMLGFIGSESARNTYLRAFSDGRGHQRIGSVTRVDFAGFRNWLKSGQTKVPVTYHEPYKSASDDVFLMTYGASVPCDSGGSMTTVATEPSKSASEPRTTGFFTNILSKAWAAMTPAERTTAMQDAAVMSGAALGKADDFLAKAPNMMTVDSGHTGWIEDHWSNPNPDTLSVNGAHGPGSSVPSGTVNVGPSQAASGNGGPRMEAQYSRHAAQTGLQEATVQLGRDILGIRGATKALFDAAKAQEAQIDILKASLTAIPVMPDIPALIEAAVAKAIAPVTAELSKLLMAKAEDKDDGKEDDEEAKSAALLAKADDKEKDKERDEEDKDDKSASATTAAELRLMAKARVNHARLRISKALDYAAEEKAKAARRAMGFAEINLAKAESLVVKAIELRSGKAGVSAQAIQADIAKAKKGVAASTAENQDIWPATTDKQADFGKGGAPNTDPPTAPSTTSPPNADLVKAIQQIESAANGMGMMTATVADLFKALSNQPKPTEPGVEGERNNLPPVFALAKASASDLATRGQKLAKLRDDNVISFGDFDSAQDALLKVQMGLPEEIIQAMIQRLPDPAKDVLTQAAA